MSLGRLSSPAGITQPISEAYCSFTAFPEPVGGLSWKAAGIPHWGDWISTAFYYSYSGTISVSGYGSFRDSDCEPSYDCDRNVYAEFELRSGFGSFGRLVARAAAQTGQYGTNMTVNFRVPSCRYIPRFQTVTYTILMAAVAPNGVVKTSQRYVTARSCR